jgi:hypothetical protein
LVLGCLVGVFFFWLAWLVSEAIEPAWDPEDLVATEAVKVSTDWELSRDYRGRVIGYHEVVEYYYSDGRNRYNGSYRTGETSQTQKPRTLYLPERNQEWWTVVEGMLAGRAGFKVKVELVKIPIRYRKSKPSESYAEAKLQTEASARAVRRAWPIVWVVILALIGISSITMGVLRVLRSPHEREQEEMVREHGHVPN